MVEHTDTLDERIQLEVRKRRNDEPTFAKEGVRKQYLHQRDLMDNLEDTERHVRKNNIAKATECIEKGKNLLKSRVKLLRLADEESWEAAEEYSKNDLADDSDDNKKISKVIKRARASKEKEKNTAT